MDHQEEVERLNKQMEGTIRRMAQANANLQLVNSRLGVTLAQRPLVEMVSIMNSPPNELQDHVVTHLREVHDGLVRILRAAESYVAAGGAAVDEVEASVNNIQEKLRNG
jgi:hypothetical protein